MENLETKEKSKTNINDLFDLSKNNKKYLKICAPMVRYSKLEFRTLVRKYDVDLCFTPMIMADSFCQSNKARLIEFSTNNDDTPVIAQFAANNLNDLLSSAEMIYPYVDGIDLNCGCPQRWAIQSGYGCALMSNPELIKDMVSTLRRQLPKSFSVSVKMRLLQKSISATIDLCRQIEKCGIDFMTIHGRTAIQKAGDPSNQIAIGEIKKSLNIPLIANGDIRTLDEADQIYENTNCDGVMSARGILTNPALFSGYVETPIECVQHWLNIVNINNNITFQCFHHHLTFMMERLMNKKLRIIFNNLNKKSEVYDFLKYHFNIEPYTELPDNNNKLINCSFSETNYRKRKLFLNSNEDYLNEFVIRDATGSYFNEKKNQDYDNDDDLCDLDFMNSSLFN